MNQKSSRFELLHQCQSNSFCLTPKSIKTFHMFYWRYGPYFMGNFIQRKFGHRVLRRSFLRYWLYLIDFLFQLAPLSFSPSTQPLLGDVPIFVVKDRPVIEPFKRKVNSILICQPVQLDWEGSFQIYLEYLFELHIVQLKIEQLLYYQIQQHNAMVFHHHNLIKIGSTVIIKSFSNLENWDQSPREKLALVS